jgi:hypothetical protein
VEDAKKGGEIIMERRINTQNWDIFDYYTAIKRHEKWIYQIIALKFGLAIGSGIVNSGIKLQEGIAEEGRNLTK